MTSSLRSVSPLPQSYAQVLEPAAPMMMGMTSMAAFPQSLAAPVLPRRSPTEFSMMPQVFQQPADGMLVQQGADGVFRTAARRSYSPMPTLESRLPVLEMPVLQSSAPEVTVIEKVVEQQGLAAQELQVILQGERARMSQAMQEILGEQSQNFTELIKDEIRKVTNLVNSSGLACSDRIAQLENERSSRSAVIQAVGRDFDGLQAQIATLEQFRIKISGNLDQAGREREEVMTLLDSVTKDIRGQHSVVHSGLAAQKDQQLKSDSVLANIRSDLEAVIAETRSLRTTVVSSQHKDIQAMQKDQHQKVEQAVQELRRQTQQSIEVVRSEAANEIQMMRQHTLNGLVERVRCLEGNHAEQDMKDLAHMMQIEKSARAELFQTFEALRTTYLQTCSELRGEINALPDKMTRIARSVTEEASMRDTIMDKTMELEQKITELKGMISRQGDAAEPQAEATRRLEKDLQELWKEVREGRSANAGLGQMFEADQQVQIRATTDLRADIQLVRDKMNDLARAPAEDRYARECCLKVEQGMTDLRTVTQHKIAEFRAEMLEAQAPKEMDEMKRLLQVECDARRDLSSAVDAYRMSHLQTSTDLRGDLDRSLEKFDRVESVLERACRTGSFPAVPASPSVSRVDLEKVSERLITLESAFEKLGQLELANLRPQRREERATSGGPGFSTPLRSGLGTPGLAGPAGNAVAGTAAN